MVRDVRTQAQAHATHTQLLAPLVHSSLVPIPSPIRASWAEVRQLPWSGCLVTYTRRLSPLTSPSISNSLHCIVPDLLLQ